MKKLLTEPLLHFLLLGVSLFIAHSVINPVGAPQVHKGREIVITAGTIEHLAITYANVWQRSPSAGELKGLIDEHVKEEVLNREAIRVGLDQNDPVVRRRLRQKMEFLIEDFATTIEPADADLTRYLNENAEAFREPSRFTFEHVYLSEGRDQLLETDAAALLARLRADPSQDPNVHGDVFLGPHALIDESRQSLASQFGDAFPEQLESLTVGEWDGPVRSGFGLHLVRLAARSEGGMPPLELVRDQVKQAFLAARRSEVKQTYLDTLLSTYRVTIDWPTDANADESAVRQVSLQP